MLELRPNCELCNADLPATSDLAMICTYECTFCQSCVEKTLYNVCPNCGGGFCKRPIRPSTAHRTGVSLIHQPASLKRVNTQYSTHEIKLFAQEIKSILPKRR